MRNNLNLPIPKMQKSIGQRSHSYLKIKTYNKLPNHVKNIPNYRKFQKELKTYLQNTPRLLYIILLLLPYIIFVIFHGPIHIQVLNGTYRVGIVHLLIIV